MEYTTTYSTDDIEFTSILYGYDIDFASSCDIEWLETHI